MIDPRTCSSLCAQAQARDEASLAREFGEARALSAALSFLTARLLETCRRSGTRSSESSEQILPPA